MILRGTKDSNEKPEHCTTFRVSSGERIYDSTRDSEGSQRYRDEVSQIWQKIVAEGLKKVASGYSPVSSSTRQAEALGSLSSSPSWFTWEARATQRDPAQK